jgi:hypothetical protein
MKKLLLSLALILVCQFSFGRDLSDITRQFASKPNAQYMLIPQDMLKMFVGQILNKTDVSKYNVSKEDINHVIERIDSVAYMSLDDCSDEVKGDFNNKISDISSCGYDKIEEINGTGAIFKKEKNGNTTEIVAFITKDNNYDLVRFFGNIKPEEVQALLGKVSNLKF